MDRTILSAHHRVNRAIIACRGIYAAWAGAHGIGYNGSDSSELELKRVSPFDFRFTAKLKGSEV